MPHTIDMTYFKNLLPGQTFYVNGTAHLVQRVVVGERHTSVYAIVGGYPVSITKPGLATVTTD